MKIREIKPISLRLDPETNVKVRELAASEKRSINAQLQILIEKGLKQVRK